MVENIFLKKKNPMKFLGRVLDREVTSSSGFQALKPILARNVYKLFIFQVEKNLTDEDKFFSQ